MRKITDGEIRNKERTKDKLIEAVGELIIKEGYTSLGVNKVAKLAKVDKQLIYRYFGSLDELINAYFRRKDFWINLNNVISEDIKSDTQDHGQTIAKDFLVNLFNHLDILKETQKIILWEISEKSFATEQLSLEREMLRSNLFQITDPKFENSEIDLRACYAILCGGIYYLTLYANATGGTFCEINIMEQAGRERINKAIACMIDLLFATAEPNKTCV
ncbi:TetR/AcrR family transcriptional regulator [Sphingobacterium sp. UDSM-2020]|uniref:TetR/AcrR family transcriptional regulator n=1 Tax=Sphingobacterium sp. UDSM-2020 TaxID=2795738 RepID=UPI001936429C|nr:TetR/AcrR family transcriptional regulator [Sphingobacterium sp. UDSM-2020]QQD13154.1 TetR/AcrR family transcriptional regulator [Sphingobacterium sp. UDSM-2020]